MFVVNSSEKKRTKSCLKVKWYFLVQILKEKHAENRGDGDDALVVDTIHSLSLNIRGDAYPQYRRFLSLPRTRPAQTCYERKVGCGIGLSGNRGLVLLFRSPSYFEGMSVSAVRSIGFGCCLLSLQTSKIRLPNEYQHEL